MTLADRTGVDTVARLRAVIMRDAVHFGAGVRRSGRPYEWILDLRVLLLRAEVLDDVCRALWSELRPHRPDAVIGVGLSGTVLVTGVLTVAWRDDGVRLRGAVVRSEPKHHGLAKTLEGDDVTGRRLGFVDDIVNSGDTLSIAVRAAQRDAARVVAAAAIVSFEGAGADVARQHRIPFTRLLTTAELGLADPAEAADASTEPVIALPVGVDDATRSDRRDLLGYRNDGTALQLWFAHSPGAITTRTIAADGHAVAAGYGGDVFVASRGQVRAVGPGPAAEFGPTTWAEPWPIGPGRPVSIAAGSIAVIVITDGDAGIRVHVRPTAQRGRSWSLRLADSSATATPTAMEWTSTRSVVVATGQVLRCVHVDDGRGGWEYRLPAQITAVRAAGPLCFVTDRAGRLVALTDHGTPAWTARVESGRRHAILATDSRVLAGTGRRTVALSIAGEQRWILGAGAAPDRAVLGPNGVLSLVDDRHRDRIERVDVATGSRLDTVVVAHPVQSLHRCGRQVVLRDEQDGFALVPEPAGGHGDR